MPIIPIIRSGGSKSSGKITITDEWLIGRLTLTIVNNTGLSGDSKIGTVEYCGVKNNIAGRYQQDILASDSTIAIDVFDSTYVTLSGTDSSSFNSFSNEVYCAVLSGGSYSNSLAVVAIGDNPSYSAKASFSTAIVM